LRFLLTIVLSFVALCFQHPIHELSHVAAARMFSEKVIRIQWLNYQGGTRVFYKNEPDLSFQNVDKKWIFIAGAGFFTTTILGYFFAVLYFVVSIGLLKAILCLFSIIFLLTDCLYFLIGSIGNFGDITGIRKIMKMSKTLSTIVCAAVFILHVIVINLCFY
jgi:hypothetical protein